MTVTIVDGWYLRQPCVGLGVFTRRLLEGLLKRQADLPCRLKVAVPSDLALTEPFRFLGDSCLPLKRVRPPHPLLAQVFWQWSLGRYSQRQRPPVRLLCPGPFWSTAAAAHAVVCHDLIPRYYPRYLGRRGLRRWLYFRTERFMAGSDTVVAVSEHTAGDLWRHVGVAPSRTRVIREWLPEAYTPESGRAQSAAVAARYSIPRGAFLYVGGFDCRKNVELLIRAYARVRSKAPCPPLVLAGLPPPERSRLHCAVNETLREVGLLGHPCVHLPGRIGPDDMPGLYASASLLVYPSLYEGFGLPPMEAMGCGCPAVVTDASSLPEVVTDPAYRFAGDDVRGVAELLTRSAGGRLPLNPGFRRAHFEEASAIDAFALLLDGPP